MTIYEAITTLSQEHSEHHSFNTDIIGKALLLAIAALERIRSNRNQVKTSFDLPLPGETDE